MTIRPMLAAQKYREAGDLWGDAHLKVVEQHLETDGFLYGQPKWDGMRAVLYGGRALSRSWKPLANAALQSFAGDHPELLGLDCEVFTGHQYAQESFRESMSGVRSQSGSGELSLIYFDHILNPNAPYDTRMEMAATVVSDLIQEYIGNDYHVIARVCPTQKLYSIKEILDYETKCLEGNFEGAIVRRPFKAYKYNRATAIGGELVKVKRRDTVDAIVEGYEPRYQNQNEAKTSELGFTTRSSHKEGLVEIPMLGALHIRILNGPLAGTRQKVGVFRGLSHTDLTALWETRETLEGRHCEVSIDKATGGYEAGRCPVFIRWRDSSEF